MQLEVGAILDGKVTGITNFGAFVDIGDGKSGMVHISEVASTYVKDINDFLKEGQQVKVKIINIYPDGKINLSIKKATEQASATDSFQKREKQDNFRKPQNSQSQAPRKQFAKPTQTASTLSEGPTSFEDMLNKFKQTSDERIADLRHSDNNRRSTARSRSRK